jgi:hypothetical protein
MSSLDDFTGTYWKSEVIFIRLPGDPAWSLECFQYNGRDARTVHRARGRGLLTDHVLAEFLNVFEAVTEGLAATEEGIQHWEPRLA